MSQKEEKNKAPKAAPSAEAAASTDKCRSQDCKQKTKKFGFCQEHFEMYMAGVLRGDGTKPVDFEKKYEQFLASKKVA